MPHTMSVTFLGTSSGGGPIDSRNCSSLVMDALGDGSLWMVDCAEGTVRQFTQQPARYGEKHYARMMKVSKIFITHMHADHTMGLITLLRNVLGIHKSEHESSPAGDTAPANHPTHYPTPKVEIYGPAGIRLFVRSIFTLTHSHTADKYSVHELLMPGEDPSAPITGTEKDPLHASEVPGKDVKCDEDGFWRGITEERMGQGYWDYRVVVDAGPIIHRDPCLGFIIREIPPTTTSLAASRSIVVLGDTSDPKGLIPLIVRPNLATAATTSASVDGDPAFTGVTLPTKVSLLIHECTDAYIPAYIDTKNRTGKNRNHDIVQSKATAKGHSTPVMAGAFARDIGAERLVLNHIGARFPAPPPLHRSHSEWYKFQHACIQEIERQALESFNPSPPPRSHSPDFRRLMAAWDFLTVEIPPHYPEPPSNPGEEEYEDGEHVNVQNEVEAQRRGEHSGSGQRGGGSRGWNSGGGSHSRGNSRGGNRGRSHGHPSKRPRA